MRYHQLWGLRLNDFRDLNYCCDANQRVGSAHDYIVRDISPEMKRQSVQVFLINRTCKLLARTSKRAALQRAEHNKGGTRGEENFSLMGSMVVDQPNMRTALDHLQNAKRNLQSASAEKVATGKTQLTW